MCLSGCVHDQGLKGHFRTCTGIKSTGSHDRSQGRIGCGILFPENVNYQRGAMKTSKYTCITPPPFPEELKKFLSRPRSPAAQSIIRTSSSVQAGLDAHWESDIVRVGWGAFASHSHWIQDYRHCWSTSLRSSPRMYTLQGKNRRTKDVARVSILVILIWYNHPGSHWRVGLFAVSLEGHVLRGSLERQRVSLGERTGSNSNRRFCLWLRSPLYGIWIKFGTSQHRAPRMEMRVVRLTPRYAWFYFTV